MACNMFRNKHILRSLYRIAFIMMCIRKVASNCPSKYWRKNNFTRVFSDLQQLAANSAGAKHLGKNRYRKRHVNTFRFVFSPRNTVLFRRIDAYGCKICESGYITDLFQQDCSGEVIFKKDVSRYIICFRDHNFPSDYLLLLTTLIVFSTDTIYLRRLGLVTFIIHRLNELLRNTCLDRCW